MSTAFSFLLVVVIAYPILAFSYKTKKVNLLKIMQTTSTAPIAVAYLARGTDTGSAESLRCFVDSYRHYSPGLDHTLYVLLKGYPDKTALDAAQKMLSGLSHTSVFLEDDGFDIGAYIRWSANINAAILCPLSTSSEILCDGWLLKLARNLELPNVGLVGATASFESLRKVSDAFPAFPNIHIRSTGFMIRMDMFRRVTSSIAIRDKRDALLFESGIHSMTRQVLALDQRILLVGRNGRGYSPQWWPSSDTFRQGVQDNLLIADNQTRSFAACPWPAKRALVEKTWGAYSGKTLIEKNIVLTHSAAP